MFEIKLNLPSVSLHVKRVLDLYSLSVILTLVAIIIVATILLEVIFPSSPGQFVLRALLVVVTTLSASLLVHWLLSPRAASWAYRGTHRVK